MSGGDWEFEGLKPRLLLLLEMYRNAASDEARANLTGLFQDVFLATAWNVATDLLNNGWQPTAAPARAGAGVEDLRPPGRLRLVKG
ncbi:hypothetical protein ACO2Q3_02110 [Caulobacter sp. KR2-114]|uniref:hypothetical protein n=1 Tax=Caulobacter sp. KR2-114 TaxID=3400912 RepID=UPI003C09374F